MEMEDKAQEFHGDSIGDGISDLGSGLAWFGFWLMIGLANFGGSTVVQQFADYAATEAVEGAAPEIKE